MGGGSRWAGPSQKTGVIEVIIARNSQYIWFIGSHAFTDAKFVYSLKGKFLLIGHRRFVGVDVWLFRNDKFIVSSIKGN